MRNPRKLNKASCAVSSDMADRRNFGVERYQPPRCCLVEMSKGERPASHHSETFPYTSKSPSGFGRSCPTGQVWSAELTADHAYFSSRRSELPKNRLVVEPARAAYSHSCGVGSRYPVRVR